jgi:hypothetical protein
MVIYFLSLVSPLTHLRVGSTGLNPRAALSSNHINDLTNLLLDPELAYTL